MNLYKRVMDDFFYNRNDITWISEKPSMDDDSFIYSTNKGLIGSKHIDDFIPMISEFKGHTFNFNNSKIAFRHYVFKLKDDTIQEFIETIYRNNPNKWSS